MKSSVGGGVNVGGSSILVIFVLLCITTFATLSMVSAAASYRLAQQVAVSSRAYYEADNLAEITLANLSWVTSIASDDELEGMINAFGAELSDGIIGFAVPITNVLSIVVELEIVVTQPGQRHLNIISWRMQADYDEGLFGGDPLELWTGFN